MLRRLLLGASLMTSVAIYIGFKIYRVHHCSNVVVANVNPLEIASKNPNASDDDTHIVNIIAPPPPRR